MFYRIRTRLPDTPGALATLAHTCGLAEVNILGLQIYADLGSVTDDLVVEVPDAWPAHRVVELVESAGGAEVTATPCSASELQDQPTQWLAAARALIGDPDRLPQELTRLLGPRVALSPTEQVRVAALTDIADAVRRPAPERLAPPGTAQSTPARTPHSVVEYDESDQRVVARVGDGIVGAGHVDLLVGQTTAQGYVEVAPAWRRMGVGRQLLRRLCVLAAGAGASELTLLAPPAEEGVVPLLAAAGLRGRIRLTDGGLEVRLSLAAIVAA